MMIDLQVLMQEKERRSFANAIVAGMSMHPPSGGLRDPRVYLRNRLLRRDQEQRTRGRIRER